MSEDERRRAGMELMARVYGWDEAPDVSGDFFAMTADHLFARVWSRDGLSIRDRRLLLIGLLVGTGDRDVVELQLDAALKTGDLTADELREIVVFLTHYAGWPRGTVLNAQVEKAVAKPAGR